MDNISPVWSGGLVPLPLATARQTLDGDSLRQWFGMVWYSMAWYDIVWHGMVWMGFPQTKVWYGVNATARQTVVDGGSLKQVVSWLGQANYRRHPSLHSCRWSLRILLVGRIFWCTYDKEEMSTSLMLMMMNSIWDRHVNNMKNYSLRCSLLVTVYVAILMIFVALLLELAILILYCELSSCLHFFFCEP